MRKFLTLFLALITLLSLTGCAAIERIFNKDSEQPTPEGYFELVELDIENNYMTRDELTKLRENNMFVSLEIDEAGHITYKSTLIDNLDFSLISESIYTSKTPNFTYDGTTLIFTDGDQKFVFEKREKPEQLPEVTREDELRDSVPEYFNLDITNGLTLEVWKTSDTTYQCTLAETIDSTEITEVEPSEDSTENLDTPTTEPEAEEVTESEDSETTEETEQDPEDSTVQEITPEVVEEELPAISLDDARIILATYEITKDKVDVKLVVKPVFDYEPTDEIKELVLTKLWADPNNDASEGSFIFGGKGNWTYLLNKQPEELIYIFNNQVELHLPRAMEGLYTFDYQDNELVVYHSLSKILAEAATIKDKGVLFSIVKTSEEIVTEPAKDEIAEVSEEAVEETETQTEVSTEPLTAPEEPIYYLIGQPTDSEYLYLKIMPESQGYEKESCWEEWIQLRSYLGYIQENIKLLTTNEDTTTE